MQLNSARKIENIYIFHQKTSILKIGYISLEVLKEKKGGAKITKR